MEPVYVAFDLEATGMNPAADRIIEVAAVKFTLDRVLDRWQTLVRPGGPVPLAVTTLTGLSQQQVNAAPPFPAISPTLRAFVRDHPIVGQSADLDLAMVRAAGLALTNPVVDTYELAALLLPQLPTYSLGAVASALKVPVPDGNAHRAAYDAELTRRVFGALWERLMEHEAETLGEIVQLSAGAGWPLHRLFVEAQRTKTRHGFGASLGTAMRQAMRTRDDAPGELAYLMPRSRPEPLAATGQTAPLPEDALAATLEPASAFARRFPNFEHRPQQVEMVRAVTTAFNHGGHLLVEAGTGTGKSMAYLLPAVALAVRRGETVVVSTKTIQLQDQLFHKDVPAVQSVLATLGDDDGGSVLPSDFKAALVKGRTNYLCLRRWLMLRRTGVPPDEVRTLVKIILWLQATETGDRAELRLLPGEDVTWARVMATPDACDAATCPFNRRGQCFLFRARREAESAHVVVINHALLLSDMLAGSQVLPPYKHLIVDEAHRLEDEATAQLGFTVDRRAVFEALDGLARAAGGRYEGLVSSFPTQLRVSKVPATVQSAADKLVASLIEAVTPARRVAADLFARLEAFATERAEAGEQYDPRLRLTRAVRQSPGWAGVEMIWEELSGQLAVIQRHLSELAALLERLSPRAVVDFEGLVAELGAAQRPIGELGPHLQRLIANPDDTMVSWLETNRGNGGVSLHAAPLEVATTLARDLYSDKQTVILTSATLTVDRTFGYVRERLGLADAAELRLESPFDFRRSALLYLTDDLPEPGKPGYQRRLEAALVGLCVATEGRALVLFTSHSALRMTYSAIKEPLESRGVLVMAQRIDGSPRQLLDRLKASGKAVVLGTATFWEGVDVVGDALSVLAIAKLPFKVPTDPVFAARCELLANPFAEYAVPQTVLTFKQGFGRLIRSATDRGIVAVLDRRLLSKSYGRAFLSSLPECTVRQGPVEHLPALARRWLDRGAAVAAPE